MTGYQWLIAGHAFLALMALPLGAFQLLRRRRGDALHRRVGRTWVFAMGLVAISSFAIRDLRPGQFSLLHILSVVTLVTVTLGVVQARRGNIEAHRAMMRGSWLGLVGAFIGAVAVPDRTIPTFVVSDPLGSLGALLAVAVGSGTVIVLGSVRRPTRPEVSPPPVVMATPRGDGSDGGDVSPGRGGGPARGDPAESRHRH